MKQTNNAIKFLMAQYRAIFKNAYFKGMATALVLTAGLAAGAAQAADDFYYSDDGMAKLGQQLLALAALLVPLQASILVQLPKAQQQLMVS